MKKILIIANDFSKSGVPLQIYFLVKNLSKLGFNFTIIYFQNEKNFYQKYIEALNCKTIFFDLNLSGNKIEKIVNRLFLTRKIRNLIKQQKYDLIHSFTGFLSYYFLKAAKKCKIKKRICHVNFVNQKPNRFFSKLIYKIEKFGSFHYSTNIFFDSEKNLIEMVPKRLKEKCIAIPTYYDDENFHYVEKSNDRLSIIQVASFSDNKNQIFSLEVIKEIKKFIPNVIINFVGFENSYGKGYLDKMNDYIKENQLQNNVMFHNFDENLFDLYSQNSFLIFPSKMESFGIVVIEAQACGLTCFCSSNITKETNVGGCFYWDISNPIEWANKILKIFESSSGKHNKYDLSRFSQNNITTLYIDIYNR